MWPRQTPSAEERFWSKVNKTETCWLWTAGLCTGYGRIRIDQQLYLAHRVSYMWLVGEIPEGLELDHLCRVRNCVNPAHLEPVTRRENTIRGLAPKVNGDRLRGMTHCKRNHELTPENVWIQQKTGWRYCRACVPIRKAERQAVA